MKGGWLKKALLALTLVLGAAPVADAASSRQHGQAVYYGGRYDRATRMTAAHRTLPFGTWVRVTHRTTGRSVVVKINDRGPFGNSQRVIDLSRTAAARLGITRQGIAPVTVTVIRRP